MLRSGSRRVLPVFLINCIIMWYYVYVLYQESRRKFYVGFTNNLKRRLTEHLKNKVRSTRFKKSAPRLVFYEAFISEKAARKRERYFKTTKGKRMLKLILRDLF